MIKKIINYFIGIISFILAGFGICLSASIGWIIIRVVIDEIQKSNLTLEGFGIASIIIIIVALVALIIANIGNFIEFGIKKFKNVKN